MTRNHSKLFLLSCQTGSGDASLGDALAYVMPGIGVMAAEDNVPRDSVIFTSIDRFEIMDHESAYRTFKH